MLTWRYRTQAIRQNAFKSRLSDADVIYELASNHHLSLKMTAGGKPYFAIIISQSANEAPGRHMTWTVVTMLLSHVLLTSSSFASFFCQPRSLRTMRLLLFFTALLASVVAAKHRTGPSRTDYQKYKTTITGRLVCPPTGIFDKIEVDVDMSLEIRHRGSHDSVFM